MTGRASRRPAAQQRLTAGFLATLPQRVQEVAGFLSDSTIDDPAEAAGFALQRMSETARSLGLEGVAAEATRAAENLSSKSGIQILVPLVREIRHVAGVGPFACIGLVGNAKQVASIDAQDDRSCEPLRTFTSVDALRADLAVDWPQAIVLPASLGSEALGVVGAFECPVFVYGPARDWEGRQLAARVGAAGYLAEPLSVAELLSQIRYLAGRAPRRSQVAVLGPSDWAKTTGAALEASGITPLVHTKLSNLASVMHSSYPDAVVFGAFPEADVRDASGALRQHVGRSHVAILAIGKGETLYNAGADDVLSARQALVPRVRARLHRFGDHFRDLDDLTHVPNRAGGLEAVQRMVASSIRNNEVLAVSLVHAVGLAAASRAHGREAENACLRHLAAALERGVRRFDVVGYLGGEVFVAAMGKCRQTDALRRMNQLKEAFESRVQADRRLREVHLDIGTADTTMGTEGLMIRAEAALNAARASS